MAAHPTIAIFGSTGGSGLALLRSCLAASYQCTVLVRNPKKLLSLLSLSEAPSNLSIVTGSIQDVSVVQRALLTSEGRLVDMVVSCIGFVASSAPAKTSLNPLGNIDDPNICRNGTENIVSAITETKRKEISGAAKESRTPPLVVLSSTGTSRADRDVPLLMTPLYYWVLKPQMKDKKAMEDFLHSSAVPPSQPWIVIRPSLLLGDGKGERSGNKIRVGIEQDGVHQKLEIGYTIKREDVGGWIYQEIVQGDQERWNHRAVTLTY